MAMDSSGIGFAPPSLAVAWLIQTTLKRRKRCHKQASLILGILSLILARVFIGLKIKANC